MADLFKLKAATSDKIFYEGDAIMVGPTTTEGQVSAHANHIPLTAIISPGVLKIHEEGQVRKVSLISGLMETLPEQVVITAEVVEWLERIDANRTEEARARAERRLKENSAETGTLRAEMALKKALTRLEARQQVKETLRKARHL